MKNKFSIALSLAVIVAMLVTSLALADNLQGDDLVAGNNASKQPGQTGTAVFFLQASGGDGCNATSTNPVVVSVTSTQAWLTIDSPGTVSLTDCGSGNAGSIGYSVAFNAPVGGVAIVAGIASGGKPGNNGFNNTPGDFNVTVVASPDSTAPVITPNISGTLGNNGWYTSDVTVSWTVTDPESTITSTNGCGSSSVTADTAGTTFTCSATSAGGTSSQSVTIKRDATAPTISGFRSPAANANGWNNTDVAVTFTCGDNLSGVVSCGPDATLTGEGANQSVLGTAVDDAGNSASTTVTGINIDKTKPVITGSRTPGANSDGWNNTDVVVSFSCTDSGSGLDVNTVAGTTVSTEGAGQSVTNTGTCTDKAGNTADSVTVSDINIDKTAPTITGAPDRAANSNGWYNADVTVSFSCDDALSGVDTCSDSSTLGEGANQSVIGTVTDLAGNSASATVSGINIDKTAPVLSPSVSPNPALLNGSATANPGASDALSGIDTASCEAVDTSSVGSHSVNCSATDKAGNIASASAVYTVQYATGGMCLGAPGHSILQPINADGSSVFKQKSTVPAKFRVCDANGVSIGTSGVVSSFKLVKTVSGLDTQTLDALPDSTTPDTAFRWDPTDQQWIFNISTKSLTAGKTYYYRITLNDGSFIDFNFGLK